MSATQTVRLTQASNSDVFNPSIKGVDPITRSGTKVPTNLVKELRAKAREYGVSISVSSS